MVHFDCPVKALLGTVIRSRGRRNKAKRGKRRGRPIAVNGTEVAHVRFQTGVQAELLDAGRVEGRHQA
jgi:hypothetical protein